MNHFLTSIQVNKILHLENFNIEIDKNEKKHLIITGKNGCGKTSLLNALLVYLQRIKDDNSLYFMNAERYDGLKYINRLREENAPKQDILRAEENLLESGLDNKLYFGELKLEFSDIKKIAHLVNSGEFLFAFYEANRKTEVIIPTNPQKPDLTASHNINDSKRSEFVKFLIDLKIQESLARNENEISYANDIKTWFISFENLLKELFEDEELELHFNYKNYVFTIKQGGKSFGFNKLSDGYSAIIDIVADLILKMQSTDNLTRAYKKQGIVLIDEIETHLHLELQKAILPMLTKIFPNIQFIVSTHSPFVLNSLDNAIAYDLEKRQSLNELTEYSYEALAEGYFNVSSSSTYLQAKLNQFKLLAENPKRDTAEEIEFKRLDEEFSNMNEALTPSQIRGQYLQIKFTAK